MKKQLLLLFVLLACARGICAQEQAPYGHGDTSWFTQARFGMFIHWGLYSMPARGEWVRNRERLSNEDYQIFFDLFNPDLYNPKEWARTAREAGMKYAVLTSKHHEGFCLWDSQYTDYKVTNTPVGRDLLREFTEAFRAEGLKIGFYYSLLDWRHPDFTMDNLHPMKGRIDEAEFNKGRDMRRYTQYMRNQVTELLTQYGPVDIIWFDFSYAGEGGKGKDDWEAEEMIRLARSLCPNILINNRLDIPEAADFITPEQIVNANQMPGSEIVWEGCQTFSGSWGYHREESSWKSPKDCLSLLIHHVSRGGNMLMNVGPTSRGNFDERAMNILHAFRDWMKFHSRAIHGCGAAPAEIASGVPQGCMYTYNPKTKCLYLHLASPYTTIWLPGLNGKVKYAQLLADGSQLQATNAGEGISLNLQIRFPESCGPVPVIELFLK